MFNGKLQLKNTKLQCTTKCSECNLYKTCKSPKLTPIGNNKKNIMVIRGVPTRSDDDYGESFTGDSYDTLYPFFKEQGVDLFEDCVLLSCISCFVNPYKEPKRVNPAIQACFPTIKKAIQEYKPKIIILAGFDAVKSVIGQKYPRNLDNISLWRGFAIPDSEYNAWICPIFDPHEVARLSGESGKSKNYERTTKCIWKQDIARALSLQNVEMPVYKNLERFCKVLKEDAAVAWCIEAKSKIKELLKNNIPVYLSFDYETNMLKPHNSNSRIYSISICYNENQSVSFRWTPKTREACLPLLTTKKIKHIMHNGKFELAWSKWVGKFQVGNFYFDPMIGAHILDNRSGITGLKFLSYVYFGVADYSSHVKEYLEADSSYEENKIETAPEYTILLYGAMDSLLTQRIAMKFMKKLDMLN